MRRDDFLGCGVTRHDEPVAACNMTPPFVHDAFAIVLEENIVRPGGDICILRRFLYQLAGTDKLLRVTRAIQWTFNQLHD